jgi:hypothetical protein
MSTQSEIAPRRKRLRLGIGLATGYIVLAISVYVLIARQPPDDGLEWLPLYWLALPWSMLDQSLLIPGILINAVLLYGCGCVIQLAWRARSR